MYIKKREIEMSGDRLKRFIKAPIDKNWYIDMSDKTKKKYKCKPDPKVQHVHKELLPCPFCGGAPRMKLSPTWIVYCATDNCLVHPVTRSYIYKPNARRAWNQRSALPVTEKHERTIPEGWIKVDADILLLRSQRDTLQAHLTALTSTEALSAMAKEISVGTYTSLGWSREEGLRSFKSHSKEGRVAALEEARLAITAAIAAAADKVHRDQIKINKKKRKK